MQPTMNMLAQAQSVCGTTAGVDEDMVDYINVLRESVLEAYSGIVQVRTVVCFACLGSVCWTAAYSRIVISFRVLV